MIAWLSVAYAQEIQLGAGRIAVLDPGFQPTSVGTSHSTVLDVQVAPPTLLLIGLKAGTSTLSVDRADGTTVTWEVTVAPGDVAPTGGPGLLPPGDVVGVPVGQGVVCTIPNATTFVKPDDPSVALTDLGAGRWFVGVGRVGHEDVAFTLTKGRPVVLAVTSASTAIPASCARATQSVKVPVGQTVTVDAGKAVASWVVQAPDVAYATVSDAAPTAIRITGVRPGTTTVAARTGAADAPTLRTIEVVATGP
jgi:hypothetical protein